MVINRGMLYTHHFKPRQNLLPGMEGLGPGRPARGDVGGNAVPQLTTTTNTNIILDDSCFLSMENPNFLCVLWEQRWQRRSPGLVWNAQCLCFPYYFNNIFPIKKNEINTVIPAYRLTGYSLTSVGKEVRKDKSKDDSFAYVATCGSMWEEFKISNKGACSLVGDQ